MEFGLNSVLLAIIFLLPGFLTSTLVNARTPAKPPSLSAFHETAQSLLRSAYIHLLLGLIVVSASLCLSSALAYSVPSNLDAAYFVALISANPIPTTLIGLAWLTAAFFLAAFFGSWKDPLDSLVKRLHKEAGKVSEDAFHLLTEEVEARRRSGAEGVQLWVQATTTADHVFQGQFFYASYPDAEQPRELLLAQVLHYDPVSAKPPRRKTGPHDFVYLRMDSCHALELSVVDPQAHMVAA